ncbi:hypothetical protein P22_3946 [Propionispora sp. 2/2-37]|nr:hypothetical protein P22_3946 [Propionispora sp. 2/2-37]
MAGSRAEVIIANPNGIVGDGFGFINTSRAVLTTGIPVFGGNGSLEAFRVSRGQISIEGAGLNVADIDRVDLISRAVQVNAGIWANNLNVVTGNNKVDYNTLNTEKNAPEGNMPSVSLDVGQLGGMYANKIKLVGTEQGVGVNNQGILSASGGEFILTQKGKIVNTGSVSSAGNLQITTHDNLQNSGTLYSQTNTTVRAAGVNNSGILASAQNTAIAAQTIDTSGVVGAGIQSGGTVGNGGDLTLSASGRVNSKGKALAGGNLAVTGDAVDQSGAAVYAGKSGSIRAIGGDIDNSGATLETGEALTLEAAGTVKNDQAVAGTGGQITAGQLTVTAGAISNKGGSILQTGTNVANLTAVNHIDNTGGTMAGNGEMNIMTGDLINEGGSIQAVSSVSELNITVRGTVNNEKGIISSGKKLLLLDQAATSKALSIVNSEGTLLAGQDLNIDGAGLSGTGKILSQGDLSVKLTQDYAHTGELKANGNVRVETAGTLTNQSTLLAGGNLEVDAGDLVNQPSGEISGKNTSVTASGTLTNRGLIDGEETLVAASALNNMGTGRIYGDHLAIQANSLYNSVVDAAAPVIAARKRLDIAAQNITNREHAKIFSGGDLFIGGSLDADQHVDGQATTVNNNSATIEALGSLSLAARQINNTNEHFSTQLETVSSEHIIEYQGSGSPNRYLPGTPDVYIYVNESEHLHTPEGKFTKWNLYDYTRVTQETKILTSDPGQILSGGAMQIDADMVTNDKSRIVSGGDFTGNIGTLNNTEFAGERTTTDTGTVTNYWRKKRDGKDTTGKKTTSYTPAVTAQAITLTPSVYQENTAPGGTGTQVGAHLGITQVTSATGNTVVRTGGVNTTIPNNSLYYVAANSSAHYLVETDPRFANYSTWLSSDYMLKSLAFDPSAIEKRLGDGFYEQQLIRQQITDLTGQRRLDGYASDEEQYKALMDNAAVFAKEYQLTVGVALTAEQMALLTTDIVWLVDKEVTLPDGQVTHALIPQLYVRSLKDGDLTTSGALIAGSSVQLGLSGDIQNSGTISGRNVVALTVEDIQNLGGKIEGKTVDLNARNDINIIGGRIEAADSLTVTAGRDLNVVSTTSTQNNQQGSRMNIDRIAGLYVTGDNGILLAKADRDVNLLAAEIKNSGAKGTTTVSAGNNLNLGTVSESDSNHLIWDRKNQRSDSSKTEIGTSIATQGNIALKAGKDVNARAASVDSNQGTIEVTAGNDVNVTVGEASRSVDEAHRHQGKSGGGNSTTTISRDTYADNTALATTLFGNSVTIQSGQDINIKGSNLVGTNDVTLSADRNVSITAAQETSQEGHMEYEKTSGILGGGGLGFTIGTRSEKTTQTDQSVTQTGSTVGSIGGNVNITAGNTMEGKGTTIVSGKDIKLTGKEVTLDNSVDTYDSQYKYEFKQSGLSISLGGQLVDTATGIVNKIERSKEVKDDRLQDLYIVKAYQDRKDINKEVVSYEKYKDAYKQALAKTEGQKPVNPDDAKALDAAKKNLNKEIDKLLSINVSIGSSKTTKKQTTQTETVNSSKVTAGGDVNIKATEGNINLTVADISGKDVTLDAKEDVNIGAAQNIEQNTSKTNSSSWSLGASFGLGTGSFMGVNGSAQSGKSNENGTTVTNTGSNINASDTLTIHSGGDTNLIGSKVSGGEVDITADGDLNLVSLQDSETYKAISKNAGINLSGGKTGGTNGSAGSGKTNSTYTSVTEQAGIYAGQEGFDINVGKNTDLKGAVISSEATPDKNKISTDTLTYSDIKNKAEYSASSSGVNYNSTLKPGMKLGDLGLTPNMGVTTSGDADSTTQSAISPGTIEVRSNPNQDLSGLSRDSSGALNALGKIFDKKTVQEKQELAQVFGEEAFKAIGDLAKTQKENASRRYLNATTDEERAAALADFKSWSEGGTNKILLSSVVGGLASSLGGDSFASGAVGAGTTQILMNELKNIKNPALLQWASAIVGAAAAKVVGGNVQTGASTAVSETKNNYLTHRQFELITDSKELERVAKRQDVLFGAASDGGENAKDTPAFTDAARANDSSYSSEVQYALKGREAMLEVINSAYVAGVIDINDRNIVADRLNEEATKIRENANNTGVLDWILNNASILVKDVSAGTIIDNAINPTVLAPGDLSSVILRSLDNPEDSSAIARMILLREKENTINIGSPPTSSGDSISAVTTAVAALFISKGKKGLGNVGKITYSVETKIVKQMEKRGWSNEMVDDAINNSVRTVKTVDTRNNPLTGTKNNDPATAYYSKDGGYVVRNDRTGDIVQVSDRNDPNWVAPWGE